MTGPGERVIDRLGRLARKGRRQVHCDEVGERLDARDPPRRVGGPPSFEEQAAHDIDGDQGSRAPRRTQERPGENLRGAPGVQSMGGNVGYTPSLRGEANGGREFDFALVINHACTGPPLIGVKRIRIPRGGAARWPANP